VSALEPEAIRDYLASRRRLVRWLDHLRGRRYRVAKLARTSEAVPRDEPPPLLVVIAHRWRDTAVARRMQNALEEDWSSVAHVYREVYRTILASAPALIILDLRRKNHCGCLGHRHPIVREQPFAESHEAFHGATIGEVDIAWQRVEAWPALPLQDTALDARFFEGSRLDEFRGRQFHLRLLSVFLHETNHLVFPNEAEDTVRARSLNFYRDAISSYVEEACHTLSLTIDRSFSRME
jgi:hypothetical protein